MLTVTPPADGRHCYVAKERKTERCLAGTCDHRKCDCTPQLEGVDLAEWNPTLGKKMNHLMTKLTRFNGGVRPDYFSPTEPQDGKRRADGVGRMGLHKHPVMWFANAMPTEQDLRKMAKDSGFGHEVKIRRLDGNSKALARYVTKMVAGYVTKAASDRPDVPWKQNRTKQEIDLVTGEVTERVEVSTKPTYRGYSRSSSWGVLMRDVKLAERAKVERLKLQGWAPGSWPAAGVVVQVLDDSPVLLAPD